MGKDNKGCGCGCALLIVFLAVLASEVPTTFVKTGIVVFIAALIVIGLFKAGKGSAKIDDLPNDGNEEEEENDSDDKPAELERWWAAKHAAEQKKLQDKILRNLFSMLSKMAKADGRIKAEEVEAAQKAFDIFGFAKRRRKFCTRIFNEVKDNSRTIYWYAGQFGKLIEDNETCTVVYGLLWDIACADGRLDPLEEEVLREICEPLHIPASSFESQYSEHEAALSDDDGTRTQEEVEEAEEGAKYEYKPAYKSGSSPIWEAYDVIESDPSASVDELKTAYRRIAKLHHPDLLRASGASERETSIAAARMAEINAAWEDICNARGIA